MAEKCILVLGKDKDNQEKHCDKPAECSFNACCADHCTEVRGRSAPAYCQVHQARVTGVTTTSTHFSTLNQ